MIWVVLTSLFTAPALGQEPVPWGGVSDQTDVMTYHIGPGDHVKVVYFDEPKMSGTVEVAPDGGVQLPLLGKVMLAGLDVDEASARIEQMASTYLVSPQVTVSIETYAAAKVQVLGAVKKPSTQVLKGPTPLSQVLAQAGGLDEEVQEVHVRREGQATDVIRTTALFTGQKDPWLQGGDVVYAPLPERIYLSGQVKEPGSVVYTEGLTVSQALTQAGGPTDAASLSDAYILRAGEQVPINLKKIMRGRAADVMLQPDDQIVIKESVL